MLHGVNILLWYMSMVWTNAFIHWKNKQMVQQENVYRQFNSNNCLCFFESRSVRSRVASCQRTLSNPIKPLGICGPKPDLLIINQYLMVNPKTSWHILTDFPISRGKSMNYTMISGNLKLQTHPPITSVQPVASWQTKLQGAGRHL